MKIIVRLVILCAFVLIMATALWWFYIGSQASAPVGIVVPHHDMVAPARQAYLIEVSKLVAPRTVVVVSPDHFSHNKSPFVTMTQDWDTSQGKLQADTDLIAQLPIPLQPDAFPGEHGITTLVGDIKAVFPDTKVVPIMVSREATYDQTTDLAMLLYKKCPNCLVIASVDFSHTLYKEVATLHDTTTLRLLANLDTASLYKFAEVDSPEALAFLSQWARLHDAQRFDLFSHTNSGIITSTPVGEMTTHIIGGYSKGARVREYDNNLTFMIGGDTMFARSVAQQHVVAPELTLTQKIGERFFWGVDVALINLEGVFSNAQQYYVDWEAMPPVLRFGSEYAMALKQARITAVGRENNHALDGGEMDYELTSDVLMELGIDSVGDMGNNGGVLVKQIGDTKVAFITLSLFETVNNLTKLVSEYSAAERTVIVYVHYGTEYETLPNLKQQEISKALVAAGADLIVGSHPHVVQGAAVHDGVPVVYSLGNFLFDQTFSEETQIGAVLGGVATKDGLSLFLVPVGSAGTPTPVSPEDYDRYVTAWTKEWQEYRQPDGTFFFPFTTTQ